MGMVPSRKIANLLGKKISTPAVASIGVQVVYGYGIKSENRKAAGQVNQYSRCHIESM